MALHNGLKTTYIRASKGAVAKIQPARESKSAGPELSAAEIGNLVTFVERSSTQGKSETC